ncbi:MAG: hypothetical protein QOI19_1941 [Thermoleophilaceae bacterium]|nr:hypothetical protein [Thermoleophilaceae bacterium]
MRRLRSASRGRGTIAVRSDDRSPLDRAGELVAWVEQPGSEARVAIFDLGAELLVSCSATGEFLIDPERGAVVASGGNRFADAWEHRLVGTAIPLLLAERGDLVLHACGVVTEDGRGVLFCGPSGRGKSTLATALAERGHALISEDGTALTFDPGGAVLAWPGAAADLPGSVETAEPTVVAAVVVLGPRGGERVRSERLLPAAALADLDPHAIYAGRGRLPRALAGMARLAERVPVHRAHVPDDLDSLPAAAAELVRRASEP